jgi:hypothetical protein
MEFILANKGSKLCLNHNNIWYNKKKASLWDALTQNQNLELP